MTKHRLIAVGAAAAMAFLSSTTFARVIINDGFEDGSRSSYVSSGEGDFSVVTNYVESAQPSALAPYPFSETGTGTGSDGFGSKYLFVDSDTNILWRTFGTTSSDVYLDAYTQFTTSESEVEYDPTAKIAIYLDANTNLCVISGTSESVRTPVTNILATASSIQPGTWHRVTLAAKAGSVFAFNIYLDGTLLTASVGGASTFYSLTSGEATSSGFGVMGTGALDDVVVRTTDPFASAAATINGENYETLEQALAEANGATVTLTADHAGTVSVSAAGTYVVNRGSCEFGGIVACGGSTIASFNEVGTVSTYTISAPVVVWDGAADGLKFNNLTRTVGDNTYSLRLNPVDSDTPNKVAADSSYIVIGNKNAQPGITITVQNDDQAVTNGFGTSGRITVLMKCVDMPVSESSNHGIISLLDGKKYKNGATTTPDNGTVVGVYNNSGTSGFIWKGSFAASTAQVSAPQIASDSKKTVSGAFSAKEQVVALTYSKNDGTAYYVNGSLKQSSASLANVNELDAPFGVALGGVDVATGNQFYAMKGMKIEAVAVFTTALSAAQIAAYTFPSETPAVVVSSDTAISDINGQTSAEDIYLLVSDGVTITGDTTFTSATAVHFICDGSFTITPPAENTATFDFSRVTASPVVLYTNSLPEKIGNVFTSTKVPTLVTDASSWKGTIWIKDRTVTDLNLNNYGNANSVVRLTNVAGHLARSTETINYSALVFNPTIDLYDGSGAFALRLNDGYSYDLRNLYRSVAFSALKGDGTLVADSKGGGTLVSIRDWSNFTGTLSLTNKIVSFGATAPSNADINTSGGEVWIMSEATVDIPSGKVWHAPNGVVVAGTLSYESIARLSTETAVRLEDGGVIGVSGDSLPADFATQAAKVSGSGKYVFDSSISIPFTTIALLPSGVGVQLCSGSTVNVSSVVTAEDFAAVLAKTTGSWNFVVDGVSLAFERLGELPDGVDVILENGGAIGVSGESLPADFATQAAKVSGSGNFVLANGISIPSSDVSALSSGIGVQLTGGSVTISSGMTTEAFSAIAAKVSGTGTFFVNNATIPYACVSLLPGNTTFDLGDNGLIEVSGTASVANFANNFTKVSGTGAVKYTGTSWGGISTNVLAGTKLGVVLENTAGVIVPNAMTATPATAGSGDENIIPVGYLAGSQDLRLDYNWFKGDTYNAKRTLLVHQDRDSEWSGKVKTDGYQRLKLAVTNGTASAGTLTISGTHNVDNEVLQVEAGGKVNLTGTWNGTVNVFGTLSGAGGVVNGNITLSDGATLTVNDLSNTLNGKGDLTATGTITVRLPAGTTATSNLVFLPATGTINISGATFNVYIGDELRSDVKVRKIGGGLKAVIYGSILRFN